MNIKYTFKVSILSLMKNKTRAFLTSLGVIIGVSSVIIIVGLSNSAQEVVKTKIYSYGTNAIRVRSGDVLITERDIEELKKKYSYLIKYITPLNERLIREIRYEDKVLKKVRLHATAPEYFKIRDWMLLEGRYFSDIDMNNREKVIIVGKSLDDSLDPTKSLLDKTLVINNINFKVIGILEQKGTGFSGTDYDNIILMPWTTADVKIVRWNGFKEIYISVKSKYLINDMRDSLRDYFRKKNKLLPTQDDNFSVTTSEERLQMGDYITAALSYLMIAVAGISLFVGGLGIMNIMLATVNERVREIGIRLAIGAKQHDIMVQFLTESFSLSAGGGIIGIVFGVITYYIISVILKWPFVFSMFSIFISFTFASAVGIFFGYYPAKQASQLKPIDCLRHE